MNRLDPKITTLIPSDAIQQRLTALVDEIVKKLPEPELVIVGLMRGAFMFIADLARTLYYHQIATQIDFMTLNSYEGKRSSGRVRILKNIGIDVAGKDVLLVDDILDTGLTLVRAYNSLKARQPRSLETCVLLDKKSRRTVSVQADYVGFDIPDEYVVGYGLDHNNRYRELPFIGILT